MVDPFLLVAIGRALTVFVRQSPLRSKPVQRLTEGRVAKLYSGQTSRTCTASPTSLAMYVPSVVALKPLVISSNFQVLFKRALAVLG
jgi:hypothetical protein